MEKIYLGSRGKDSYARIYAEPLYDEFFKDLFPDSLFLVLHTGDINLEGIDFKSYRYIFLIQVHDCADYVLHNWYYLSEKLDDFKDKVFAVTNFYLKIPFKLIPIDWPWLWSVKNYSLESKDRYHIRKYLCMNNQGHEHKLQVVNKLIYENLFEEGFVSLNGSYSLPSEKHEIKKPFAEYARIDDKSYNPFPVEFFQTPFHLVTESSINKEQMYITEKTLKPLLAEQLLLHIGSPKTIEYLNKYYDLDIPIFVNNWNDFDAICAFLKKPLDELNDIYSEHSSQLKDTKLKIITRCSDKGFNLFLTFLKKHNIIHT